MFNVKKRIICNNAEYSLEPKLTLRIISTFEGFRSIGKTSPMLIVGVSNRKDQ